MKPPVKRDPWSGLLWAGLSVILAVIVIVSVHGPEVTQR